MVAALSITAVGTAATGAALSSDHGARREIAVSAPAPARWLPEAVALYGGLAAIGLYRGARREVRRTERAEHQALERARLQRETEIANRALARSNAELERIAYSASHEMKAPLRAITNLTDWIEEDLGDRLTTPTRRHLDALRDRAAQLERIVGGLQRLARASRPQARVRFDAASAIASALAAVPVPGDARIVIEETAWVTGDPDAFGEIVAELVENALRYGGRPDLTVRITARAVGDGHELIVADDGDGIATDMQERIFALFETAGPRADGHGIGLARVRKLVESVGGRAWVESRPGAGATFRCAWPGAAPV
jgi:signal transduction histidine kinase